MSLLSGAGLPVGFLICCVGVSLPFGKHVHNESSFGGKSSFSNLYLLFRSQSSSWEGKSSCFNESSFWGQYSCWICDLLIGCQSSCWEGIFIISLLSGTSIPVAFFDLLFHVWVPVSLLGRHFLNESSFWEVFLF
jgi:hypothetical protein